MRVEFCLHHFTIFDIYISLMHTSKYHAGRTEAWKWDGIGCKLYRYLGLLETTRLFLWETS